MAAMPGLCAGCRNKIPTKDYLNCAFCKLKYDLPCANLTEKHFTSMTTTQKSKWKCHGCRSKQPKTDNSNTPLRPLDSPDKIKNRQDSPLANDNITQRKKTSSGFHTSNEDLNLNLDTPALSKDDVRAIFREEFNLMRSDLMQELNQTLKHMVRTEFQSIKQEIITLENSVKFLNENYDITKNTITTYQDAMGKLQKENTHLVNTVQDLQIRLQVIEQHNRSSNLEIQCVPEHRQENLMSTIMQLAKAVSCDINETDIHHCTRVAKSNKEDKRPRAIIVKLATPKLRDTFLAKTIHFNKKNSNDKVNTSHIGIGGNKSPIFVLEHLSPMNKKLHAAARHVAKEKGFKFVWIKQGRVFMRRTEDSEFIYVKNLETLDNLK